MVFRICIFALDNLEQSHQICLKQFYLQPTPYLSDHGQRLGNFAWRTKQFGVHPVQVKTMESKHDPTMNSGKQIYESILVKMRLV